MVVRAVVFDLGGVLVGFKGTAFEPKSQSFLPLQDKIDWTNSVVTDSYVLFERGKISEKEFFVRLLPLLKEKTDFSDFKKEWNGMFVFRPAVFSFLLGLKKKGFKIGILSNTNSLHYAAISNHYGLQKIVDTAVLSFECGYRKPEKEIFASVAIALKENPKDCLYVDDLQKYVEAAKGFGFNAVQYTGLQNLKAELSKLVGVQ